MAGFVGGLVVGLICGVGGVYLMWMSGKGDRTKARMLSEAQMRIAQLEQEKSKWQLQLLERFTPRMTIRGTPTNGQFITVSDSGPFRVVRMDYLNVGGVQIANDSVDRAGTSVQIPIDESKVTEIQRQGSNPEDSFSMVFRIHIEVEGMTKTCALPVKVAVNSAAKLEPMLLGMPRPKD